jgi:hypothetical protein
LVNLSLNYLERNKYLGVQSKFRCSWRWRRKNFISIWFFFYLCASILFYLNLLSLCTPYTCTLLKKS